MNATSSGGETPRAFSIAIGAAQQAHLQQRLAQSSWPQHCVETAANETPADNAACGGIAPALMRGLLHHWQEEFEWQPWQTRLNQFDHYLLDIDGLDLHFLHQRSTHSNATPLLLTHGWPGP